MKFRSKKNDRIWINRYKNGAKANLDYPDNSIVDSLISIAKRYPEYYAYEYFGKKVTYRQFIEQIKTVAMCLKNYGVEKDEVVTICMPTTPEAICSVYAVNLIGAVVNMIHPLSSEKEIQDCINKTNSKILITLDMIVEKVLNIKQKTKLQKIIVANPDSSLPPLKHYLYKISNFKKRVKLPMYDEDLVMWSKFISTASNFIGEYYERKSANDLAVILYSGGTTGNPKGIMLSNLNINALALEAHEMIEQTIPGNSVLSLLPIFHGFGLVVSIHTPLLCGMKCILLPKFNAKKFGDIIKKTRPHFLVGVPTLYEALLKQKLKKNDLKCVEAVISGGDILSSELKEKIDKYLKEHGSIATVRPGYGLTEATAATCLTNEFEYSGTGCIGIPFPDTYFKIVKLNTNVEANLGEDGEICISGPTIMLGYLNDEQETKKTLKRHKDKRIWLHTGDVGCMKKDGTIIFKQRIKRIIISSGYNVYPSHIENVICSHEDVASCAVIGIPHPYKGQVAKAYVVLKDGINESNKIKKELHALCKKNISKYSLPYEYEFKSELPKTRVGKIDIKRLENDNKK